MLNSKEKQHVLAWFRFFSKAGVLPLQINVDGWEVHPEQKLTWKKLACQVYLYIFLAHTLYKNLTLAHVFMFGQGVPLYQMVVHMVLAAASAMLSFWYYVLYIQYPETFAAFTRTTLTATATGGKLELDKIVMQVIMYFDVCLYTGNTPLLDEQDGKRWIQKLMEHSLQDVIGVGLPYLVLPLVPIICASFVYDPTMKFLLFAMVPESWNTWPSFCIWLIVEAYLLFMLPVIALPAWQVQVIAFELVNHNLKAIFAATTKW